MKLRKKNLHRLLAAETGDAEDLLGLGRSTTGKGSRTPERMGCGLAGPWHVTLSCDPSCGDAPKGRCPQHHRKWSTKLGREEH
jgi:hypothetical protein